jgi:hypothetical protein
MVKVICESEKPEFAILCDELQWILSLKRRARARQSVVADVWVDREYYPTLSLLLDGLAETLFRRNAKKVEELGKLQETIKDVYQIINRLTLNPHSNDSNQ